MKVCFDTFGCRLNKAEALQMEAAFIARGWQSVPDHAQADLIVVRGCSVTARAQHESEKAIAHIRAKYPGKRIVATGCIKTKINEFWLKDLDYATPEKTARAYLKVQDGCSCACSFCIVPQFRGKSESLDFDLVLERAREFCDAGYREIVVTGCNLSSYRSQGRDLAQLVAALADINTGVRIRLGSVEPGEAALRLIDEMARHENICRFLHLAIQSGSTSILSRMRRPYTIKAVDAAINTALDKMPHISISCDLMTGFPGETDLDFLATKMLLKRFPIAKAHIFPYSERPGTAAALFNNQIPQEIRHARAHEIAELADAQRSRLAKRFIGSTVEIVVEEGKSLSGWTGEYFWCSAYKNPLEREAPKRKDLVKMKIVSAYGHQLYGIKV